MTSDKWKQCKPNILGKVFYTFDAEIEKGLKVSVGDLVVIKARTDNWYYGFRVLHCSSQSKAGIFPANYVSIIGPNEVPERNLSELSKIIFPINPRQSKLDADNQNFLKLKNEDIKEAIMNTIAVSMARLLNKMLDFSYTPSLESNTSYVTHSVMKQLENLFYEVANSSLVTKDNLMERYNKLWIILALSREINGSVFVPSLSWNLWSKLLLTSCHVNMPIIQLEELHTMEKQCFTERTWYSGLSQLRQSTILPNQLDKKQSDIFSPKKSNLVITVENLEYVGIQDELVLQYTIIHQISSKSSHETLWQHMKENKHGWPTWVGEKFIFEDITEFIDSKEWFLLVIVYRMGNLIMNENNKQSSSYSSDFRRPIGVASFNLKEMTSANEKVLSNFYNLSESDYLRTGSELLKLKAPSTQAQLHRTLQISAQLHLSTQPTNNKYTSDAPIAWNTARGLHLRRDRPYEEDRNSLYIRLPSAEFDRANKSTGRNIEAKVTVREIRSNEAQKCIIAGPLHSVVNSTSRDVRFVTEFKTAVTYHSNSPRWKDTIEVNLEEFTPEECYVCVEFYHCSTKNSDGKKYFGTCVVALEDFLNRRIVSYTYTQPAKKVPTNVPAFQFLTSVIQGMDPDRSIGTPISASLTQKDHCRIELILCSTKLAYDKKITNYLRFLDNNPLSGQSTELLLDFLASIQQIKSDDFLKSFLRRRVCMVICDLVLLICDDCVENFTEDNDKNDELDDRLRADVYAAWSNLAGQFRKFNLTTELLNFQKDGVPCKKAVIVRCLLNGLVSLLTDCTTNCVSNHKLLPSLDHVDIVFQMAQDIVQHQATGEIEKELVDKVIVRWDHILELSQLFYDPFLYQQQQNKDIRKYILQMLPSVLKCLSISRPIDVLYSYLEGLLSTPDFLNNTVLVEEKLSFFQQLLFEKIHLKNQDMLIILFNTVLNLTQKQLSSMSAYFNNAVLLTLKFFHEIRDKTADSPDIRAQLFNRKQSNEFYSSLFYVYLIKIEKEKTRQYSKNLENDSKDIESDEKYLLRKMFILLLVYLEEWSQLPTTPSDGLEHYQQVISNISVIIQGVDIAIPHRWISVKLAASRIICQVIQTINNLLKLPCNDEFYIQSALLYFDGCSKFIMQSHLQLQNYTIDETSSIVEEFNGDMRITVMQCFMDTWKWKKGIRDKRFISQVASIVLGISMVPVVAIQVTTFPVLLNAIWVLCLDKDGSASMVCRDLISKSELLLREGKGDEYYLDSLNKLFMSNIKLDSDVEFILDQLRTLVSCHLEYRKLKESSVVGASNSAHMQFLLYSFMRFYQIQVPVFPYFQYYNLILTDMLITINQPFEAACVLKQQYDLLYWSQKNKDEQEGLRVKQQKGRTKLILNKFTDVIKENEESYRQSTTNSNLSLNENQETSDPNFQENPSSEDALEYAEGNSINNYDENYNGIALGEDWKYEGEYEDNDEESCFEEDSDPNAIPTLTNPEFGAMRKSRGDTATSSGVFLERYEGLVQPKLKETLAERIMSLLKEAKEYEYAADLCRELHTYYLLRYDYRKLAPLLTRWASFYQDILRETRLQLNYYRITFVGGVMPPYMQYERDFIFKGGAWCKTNSMIDMLKREFPGVQIKLYQAYSPSEEDSQSTENLTIYLAKLDPQSEDSGSIFDDQMEEDNLGMSETKGSCVSWKVRNFYKDHKVFRFISDYPFHIGVMDKNNEVKTLHVSRMTLESAKQLPCECAWTPIIHESREILSPIEVAIDQISRKNQSVREMTLQLQEEMSLARLSSVANQGSTKSDTQPAVKVDMLTMMLNGVLDAGVNGGIPKYIEAFFTDTDSNCTDEQLTEFRRVLGEQRAVLQDSLMLHKELAPSEMLPLHERLEKRYEELCKIGIELEVNRKKSFSNLLKINSETNAFMNSDVKIRRSPVPPAFSNSSSAQLLVTNPSQTPSNSLSTPSSSKVVNSRAMFTSNATGSSASIVTWTLDSSLIDENPGFTDTFSFSAENRSASIDNHDNISTGSPKDPKSLSPRSTQDYLVRNVLQHSVEHWQSTTRKMSSSTEADIPSERSYTPTTENDQLKRSSLHLSADGLSNSSPLNSLPEQPAKSKKLVPLMIKHANSKEDTSKDSTSRPSLGVLKSPFPKFKIKWKEFHTKK